MQEIDTTYAQLVERNQQLEDERHDHLSLIEKRENQINTLTAKLGAANRESEALRNELSRIKQTKSEGE